MQSDVIDEKRRTGDLAGRDQRCLSQHEPKFAFEKVFAAIADGLDQLAKIPTDVILMDSQYTTAVVTPEKKPLSEAMVKRDIAS